MVRSKLKNIVHSLCCYPDKSSALSFIFQWNEWAPDERYEYIEDKTIRKISYDSFFQDAKKMISQKDWNQLSDREQRALFQLHFIR